MESIKGKCEGVARARWDAVTYQALRRTLHTPLPSLHRDEQRQERGRRRGARTLTLSTGQPLCVDTRHPEDECVFSTAAKGFVCTSPSLSMMNGGVKGCLQRRRLSWVSGTGAQGLLSAASACFSVYGVYTETGRDRGLMLSAPFPWCSCPGGCGGLPSRAGLPSGMGWGKPPEESRRSDLGEQGARLRNFRETRDYPGPLSPSPSLSLQPPIAVCAPRRGARSRTARHAACRSRTPERPSVLQQPRANL